MAQTDIDGRFNEMHRTLSGLAVRLLFAVSALLPLTVAAYANSEPIAAQIKYDRIRILDATARTEAAPCYSAVALAPAWTSLKGKYWVDDNHRASPPTVILDKNDKATEREILAIFSLDNRYAECRQIFLRALAHVHPLILKTAIADQVALESLKLQLVKRQISWAEFAKAVDQKNKAVWEERMWGYAMISAQLKLQHANEIQQRAGAAAVDMALNHLKVDMDSWRQVQRQLNKARATIGAKPVFTDCEYVDDTLNCTTF